MERASKALAKLKLSSPDEIARAAWAVTVGERLLKHAMAVNLVRDRLIVEVEDALWQKNLFQMEHQILVRLRNVIGEDLVRSLEFRIGTPRRPPQTATRLAPSTDDADHIEDSVLRLVYRQARKRAGE